MGIDIAAVILAGGKSSRMGTDKALLRLGQRKMIECVLDEITGMFNDVLIISNHMEEYHYPGVSVVKDVIPDCGPLSGIHAGLIHADKDYIFVTGCDMPFISRNLIQYMMDKLKKNNYDALLPTMGKFMEPLFAIYGKRCITPIEESLVSGKLKVLDFLPKVKVGYIYQEEINLLVNVKKVFFNVNTPKDLEQARNLFYRKVKVK